MTRIDSLLAEVRYNDAPLSASTTSNWVARHGGLPPFARAIVRALERSGHTEGEAIAVAINALKRWKDGGGNVHPSTRARAAAAIAHWDAMKAAAHLTRGDDETFIEYLLHDATEVRFNPSQPRAPAGAAGGGEWAAQGGTAPSDSSTPQGRAWAKNQIGNYPPAMVKPAEKKKWDNWFRFFAMTPEQQKAFLDAAKHKKPPKPRGAPHGPPKRTKKRSEAEAILERRVSA